MSMNRRAFLGTLFTGSSALFLFFFTGGFLASYAGDKKKVAAPPIPPPPGGQSEVSADDEIAGAVGYIPDATKVNRKRYVGYKSGQQCSGCTLYASASENWGRCRLISKGFVRAGGWCGSYSPRS